MLLIFQLIFFQFFKSMCNAHLLTLYTRHTYQGENENITISNCSSIPTKFQLANSAISYDKCSRLYLDESCSGSFVTILPNIPVGTFSGAWKMGNLKVLSAGPCPSSCETGSEQNFLEQGTITIYHYTNYKGASKEIFVKGCTKIPSNFPQTFGSINTGNQCIILYYSENCDVFNSDGVSIELSVGTPYHHNLHVWNIPVLRAISFCSFKCSQEKLAQEPGKGEIVLYTENNFKGNWQKFKISKDNCSVLPSDWNLLNFSLKVGQETCVTFFSEKDCIGDSHSWNSTSTQLSSWTTNLSIKSFKSCVSKENGTGLPDINATTVDSVKQREIEEMASGQENEWSLLTIIGCIIAGFLLAFILFIIILLVYKGRFRVFRHNAGDKLTKKEIQEFFVGAAADIENLQNSNDSTEYLDNSIEFRAQLMVYDNKFEVARSQIEYRSNDLLEISEFSASYKGKIVNFRNSASSVLSNYLDVTVKTANLSSGLLGVRALLKEVKVMLFVGEHVNVVRMVGCCTENLRQGKLFVLMEFCSGGSLKNYLDKNRGKFINLLSSENISVDGMSRERKKSRNGRDSSIMGCGNMLNFDTNLLIQWCRETSGGMEFLSDAKIVHSDLTSKNIFLTEKLEAKISDYGLCRQLNSYSRYMTTEFEPWRWNSLESLKLLEFSTMSDVWSFGVVCWEVFSVGEKPYKNFEFKEQLVNSLEEGLRLNKPKYSTNAIYELMKKCWDSEGFKRPNFSEISEQLELLAQQEFFLS